MPGIDTRRRKRVSLSGESVVSVGSLPGVGGFPAVIEPTVTEFNLAEWCANHRDYVNSLLLKHAALLFRGCRIEIAAQFRQVVEATSGELLSYRERAAPRHEVEHHVYTSTEFPADQTIPLHHEMSYAHRWPLRIWFCCAQPAASGGCTPICDDRAFIAQLPASIRTRFERTGVMYVRNYGEGPDLSWQDAFQTSDPTDVEAYCAAAGMTWEWRSGGRLRTRYVGPAIVEHPQSGQIVWFNHAHMFHVSNLPADVRAALLQQFAEDELPRNAFYGDGSPIESSVLEDIRSRYARAAVRFAWQPGDVLLLDNVLASHGRDPYAGDRKILVAMADLCTHRAPAVRLS
jgi:alpha-ketoglutarate-dependent taurine dioxygenase